jgi:hypothetical protein
MTRFALPLTALFLLATLEGCSSAADRALKKSPDYKGGYSDGCASAGTQGADPRESGKVRDEQSYESDRAYRVGWDTGFNACRGYQSSGSMPPMPGQGPIPDPNPHPF